MTPLAALVDHPSGWLALAPGNTLFRCPGHAGFIAYRPQGRYRLNLGGVQAAPADRAAVLDAFLDEARASGHRVVALQVRGDEVELFRRRGFAVSQLGSSFGLELKRFRMAGGARMKLRNRVAHARRCGVRVVELGRERERTPAAWSELERISDAWLAAKGSRTLDFLVGELGAPCEAQRRVFVAEADSGRPLGFITYVPAWGTRPGYLHDLTRRLPDAPAGIAELINAVAIERFRAEGCAFLHFGLTPFVVDPTEPSGGSPWLGRILRWLGRREFVYPTRSQLDYKLKWAPDFVEREWIAFERVSPGAFWSLLVATGTVPWPSRPGRSSLARAQQVAS